jgi:transcriptional regulator with XRE-family HTH domain
LIKWHITRQRARIAKNLKKGKLKMTVGQKITKARQKLKMPRVKLAEITGISYFTLGNYERDNTEPPLSYAVRIADALGISLDYLARDRK